MLVLSRRVGEEIVIAGGIRVTVVAVNGQRVRLGITAPPAVRVVRSELLADSCAAESVPASVPMWEPTLCATLAVQP